MQIAQCSHLKESVDNTVVGGFIFGTDIGGEQLKNHPVFEKKIPKNHDIQNVKWGLRSPFSSTTKDLISVP